MLQENHDWLRSAICNEPRGHQAMVGALLCQPHEPDCVCGVIFFNIVSTLNAGKLKPGQVWRQAGILDTVFSGTIEELPDGRIIPRVCGRAWVIGEYTYIFNPGDPFRHGIPSTI
jgi:4-hydroxyproline epimerase